jgi:hypothetical protein
VIAAVLTLGTVAVALAGVLWAVVSMQARERREWAGERRALVDRAIARHTGEVIALEHAQDDRVERPTVERPVAVGI